MNSIITDNGILLCTGFRDAIRNAEEALGPARANERGGGDHYDDEAEEEEDPLAWTPKKVLTEWTNEDGIKCISIIFQLSGGSVLADSNDVEVHVSKLGDELAITEVWCPLMDDVRNYYTTFPRLKSESEENALRRSIAMCNACDALAGGKAKKSTLKMALPFRVDPTVKTILVPRY